MSDELLLAMTADRHADYSSWGHVFEHALVGIDDCLLRDAEHWQQSLHEMRRLDATSQLVDMRFMIRDRDLPMLFSMPGDDVRNHINKPENSCSIRALFKDLIPELREFGHAVTDERASETIPERSQENVTEAHWAVSPDAHDGDPGMRLEVLVGDDVDNWFFSPWLNLQAVVDLRQSLQIERDKLPGDGFELELEERQLDRRRKR